VTQGYTILGHSSNCTVRVGVKFHSSRVQSMTSPVQNVQKWLLIYALYMILKLPTRYRYHMCAFKILHIHSHVRTYTEGHTFSRNTSCSISSFSFSIRFSSCSVRSNVRFTSDTWSGGNIVGERENVGEGVYRTVQWNLFIQTL